MPGYFSSTGLIKMLIELAPTLGDYYGERTVKEIKQEQDKAAAAAKAAEAGEKVLAAK